MLLNIPHLICLVTVLFCKIVHGYPGEETEFVNINGIPVEVDQLFTISQVGEPGGWWVLPSGENTHLYGNWQGFERQPALFYFHKIDEELYLCCNGMFVHTDMPGLYGDHDEWGLSDVPPAADMKVVVEKDEQFPFIVRFRMPQDDSYLVMEWLKINYGAMWPESNKERSSAFYLNTSGYFYGRGNSDHERVYGKIPTERVPLVVDPRQLPSGRNAMKGQVTGQVQQDLKSQLSGPQKSSYTDGWTLSKLREGVSSIFKYSPSDQRLDEQLYRAFRV